VQSRLRFCLLHSTPRHGTDDIETITFQASTKRDNSSHEVIVFQLSTASGCKNRDGSFQTHVPITHACTHMKPLSSVAQDHSARQHQRRAKVGRLQLAVGVGQAVGAAEDVPVGVVLRPDPKLEAHGQGEQARVCASGRGVLLVKEREARDCMRSCGSRYDSPSFPLPPPAAPHPWVADPTLSISRTPPRPQLHREPPRAVHPPLGALPVSPQVPQAALPLLSVHLAVVVAVKHLGGWGGAVVDVERWSWIHDSRDGVLLRAKLVHLSSAAFIPFSQSSPPGFSHAPPDPIQSPPTPHPPHPP